MPEKRPERKVAKKVVEKRKPSAETIRKRELAKTKLKNIQMARRYYSYIKSEYGLTPEIEQILLRAPPLGIHGMLEKNIGAMLIEANKPYINSWPPTGILYGHFYYLGPNRTKVGRQLLFSAFFRSLEGAISIPELSIENGSLKCVGDKPALMFALQKPSSIYSQQFNSVSFRNGNNFFSGLQVVRDLFPSEFEPIPITFKEEELQPYLNKRLVVSPILYKKALIKLFLAKIIKAIKEYEKKYGQHPSVRY